jgi:hypothetical protein
MASLLLHLLGWERSRESRKTHLCMRCELDLLPLLVLEGEDVQVVEPLGLAEGLVEATEADQVVAPHHPNGAQASARGEGTGVSRSEALRLWGRGGERWCVTLVVAGTWKSGISARVKHEAAQCGPAWITTTSVAASPASHAVSAPRRGGLALQRHFLPAVRLEVQPASTRDDIKPQPRTARAITSCPQAVVGRVHRSVQGRV